MNPQFQKGGHIIQTPAVTLPSSRCLPHWFRAHSLIFPQFLNCVLNPRVISVWMNVVYVRELISSKQ